MINSYNAAMSTLAERLKSVLDKNPNLSKTGLWKFCGLSSGAVSHWFNGSTKELKGDNLIKAAAYLGVSVDWLSNGKGEIQLDKKEIKQDVAEYKAKPPLIIAGKEIPPLEQLMLEKYLKLTGSSQNVVDMLVNRLYSLEHPNDYSANPTNGKKKKAMEKQ